MVWLQLVMAALSLILLSAGIGLGWVIYRDARKRGISDFYSTLWASGAFLLAPLTIPLYLLLIVRYRQRNAPFQNRELWLIWFACTLFFPLAIGAVVLPPDPFTLIYLLLILPLFAVLLYLLIFKGFPNRQSANAT